MKLSEAILLGSTLNPQGFCADPAVGDCALWSAARSVGIGAYPDDEGRHPDYGLLRDRFPVLNTPDVGCPVCGFIEQNLGFIVWHLNDSHRWTRERIADWIETIEDRQSEVLPELLEGAIAV